MHEKNMLGNERKKLRNKRNRLDTILRVKGYISEKKRLEKEIMKILKKNDELHKVSEEFKKLVLWNDRSGIDSIKDRKLLYTKVQYDNAKEKLDYQERLTNAHDLPKKHLKTKYTDIKIDYMEVDLEYAKVNLAIAKFTKKNRKRMAELCKKYGLKRISDRTDNRYAGLRGENGSIGKDEIQRIWEDQKSAEIFGIIESAS
jgi:hypothetical protein